MTYTCLLLNSLTISALSSVTFNFMLSHYKNATELQVISNASYNSHRISEESFTIATMADEFDVDDLLEAPYKNKAEDSEVNI